MINSKQIFNGGLNCDDNERFLSNQEYLNLENLRIGVYGEGKNYRLENIPSTLLKYFYTPAGNNITIGRTVDYSKLWIIWMIANSNGNDAIYAYDVQLDITYTVLLDSQAESGFNFSRNFRIDRNARVNNGLLFYTDNNNEPKCIDLIAGIKLNQPSYITDIDPYKTPIPYTTLTVIKRPPIYQLQVAKFTNLGVASNFIATNSYQFFYRYWYKNYQYSCLSVYSQLMPYNANEDTFNYINVKLPFSEDIPDYVQQVDIGFRYGNTGKSFIVQSYNKDNSDDNAAIIAHNNNITQLGFSFYDNLIGIALDDITANTSFDNVALLSKTLELARNRLFLGNVLKGYNTPSSTSLEVVLGSYNTGGAGSYLAAWKYFNIYYVFPSDPFNPLNFQYFYAYNATLNPTSYFYIDFQTGIPPASADVADATSAWATELELALFVQRSYPPPSGAVWDFNIPPDFHDTFETTNLIVTSNNPNLQFFKSSSLYHISISFFDRFRRKCGIVSKYVNINTDDRTFDQTVFASTINWTLDNTNALTEIPDWAFYYQIHISKNLTTRFFVQIRTAGAAYVIKEADGTFDYSSLSWSPELYYAVAIDLTTLTSFGLGYTFNEGDMCRLIDIGDVVYNLSVIGQDGKYVLLSPKDVGTLSATVRFLTELYTPYKPSATEPMYEVGDLMNVSNPTTISRQYSVTNGSINGDTYAIERQMDDFNVYFTEAMSPNDNVWQFWQQDRGWTNFIDTIGQQLKETNIDYSETYINGTKTNGLNKFLPLNTKDIGNTSGEIQKLQLTNKMQESGNVMLVIATSEPLSAYLQEVQLYTAAQSGDIITTDQVIGTINPMKNSFGTVNPESVVEYNGTIWWFDAIHGVIAQYDANGVIPVSNYKMIRFWDKYAKRYIEQGKSVIESLCGFSYIDSCVDPSTREVFFTLPQTEENIVTSGIPVGYAPEFPSYSTLPNYTTSIQNRFDIYDGQPKQLIFKYEINTWSGCYLWLPDCMEYVGNKLYGWKQGNLYLFNENKNSFNTIFGIQYPQRICFSVTNEMVSAVKDVFDIAIEGNSIPNYSVAFTYYPEEQITDLIQNDYSDKEGIQYARWFRDRLSPQIQGSPEEKMYRGDYLKSVAPFIMVEWSEFLNKLIVSFVDIGIQESVGHSQIQLKQQAQ